VPNIVEKYNQAERAGRATVSNRAIESFSLELWNTLGYPFKVDSESELWRYHDSMQDGRFKENLRLIGNYSENEFELVTKTAKQILSFSERHLPIRNSGKHALTRSLHQYQLLMKHRPHNGPLRILEIGPGSGYLGLLLAKDGHQYFAMDAAQAFYLYQKKLWSDIFGSDYFDYSESSSRPDTAKVTHIPWWQFANLSIPIPDVDVVTINHALTEMHPQAVKTIFARLYSAWGDTDKKLLLAESWGYDYFNRKESMLTDIRTESFSVHRITNRITIFRPNNASATAQLIESSKTPTSITRLKRKVTKRVSNLIVRLLRKQIGQQLAKLIKRGPIHQSKVNSAVDLSTQPLYDFFENLVADERTPDEIFKKPRIGDIK
jgi:SAM-dependent methyltransferase